MSFSIAISLGENTRLHWRTGFGPTFPERRIGLIGPRAKVHARGSWPSTPWRDRRSLPVSVLRQGGGFDHKGPY